MMLQLRDPVGRLHRIESYNGETIAAWFKDWLPAILTEDSRMAWDLEIFPTTPEEQQLIGIDFTTTLNPQGFGELGLLLLNIGEKVKKS